MKLSVLAAAIVLSAATITPWAAHAAGQPQLNSQESAAATNGKPPAQAEQSKMDVKKAIDAQKYQGQGKGNANQAGNQQTNSGSPSTGKTGP